MTTRSMYAKQDKSEECGDRRQVGRGPWGQVLCFA